MPKQHGGQLDKMLERYHLFLSITFSPALVSPSLSLPPSLSPSLPLSLLSVSLSRSLSLFSPSLPLSLSPSLPLCLSPSPPTVRQAPQIAHGGTVVAT